VSDHWWVIGIDPSLTATGICTNGRRLTAGGTAQYGDGRLADIHSAIGKNLLRKELRDQWPTLAVVEDLPYHAKSAGATGMAQGVIRLALIQAKVPYVLIPPATLKKYATGRGNATKADMRVAMLRRSDEDERDDNLVDAWWLHQIGLAAVHDPRAIAVPRAQREALFNRAITWPPDVAARLLEPYERPVQEVAP
jgi:Holliday junction resolvasome RuvABC endonuclease subunit